MRHKVWIEKLHTLFLLLRCCLAELEAPSSSPALRLAVAPEVVLLFRDTVPVGWSWVSDCAAGES